MIFLRDICLFHQFTSRKKKKAGTHRYCNGWSRDYEFFDILKSSCAEPWNVRLISPEVLHSVLAECANLSCLGAKTACKVGALRCYSSEVFISYVSQQWLYLFMRVLSEMEFPY
ncbi:hypothetical protein POUND7_011921 [Theobroma cacao]